MLSDLINMKAVETFVFVFGIKPRMEACQDIIDGNTKNSSFFYSHFDISWKFVLMSYFGFSFSAFPIYALFFNPLWFLAIQLPNILLYYECIHRPYNLQDPNAGQGLERDTNPADLISDRKKENQSYFIFAFNGLLPLPLMSKRLARSMNQWLQKEEKFQELQLLKRGFWKNLGNKALRFHIRSCVDDIIGSAVYPAALLVLKCIFLLTLKLYDRLCYALDRLRFHYISEVLLSHGTSFLMHMLAFSSFYNFFFLNISSPVIITRLIVSTVCLLNHYRVLDSMISDVLFKIQSITAFIEPLFMGDIATVIGSIISIFQNISTQFSKQFSFLFAFIFGKNLHRPLYRIFKTFLSCTGYVLYGISCVILGRKRTGKLTKICADVFKLFSNLSSDDFFSIYSSVYINWRIREKNLVEQSPFSLTPKKVPAEKFVEEVWKPHCDAFLDLDRSFFPYANPAIADQKGQTRYQPPFDLFRAFSEDDRVQKIANGSETVQSPLRFNTLEHILLASLKDQMGYANSEKHLSLQEIAEFFFDQNDTLEKFENRLASSRDSQLQQTGHDSLRFAIGNRSAKNLANYIHKWLNEQGDSKSNSMSTEAKKDFIANKVTFLSLISREIMACRGSNSIIECKARANEAIEIILEHIHLCALGINGGLIDANSVLNQDLDLSATTSGYRKMHTLRRNTQSQIISNQIRNADMTGLLEDPGSRITQNQPLHIGRIWDSFLLFLPYPFVNPITFLFNQMVQSSMELQGLEAANRHSDLISQAMLGNVSLAENATFERTALAFSIPWLHSFNLDSFHRAQPLGWQLRKDLNLLDLSNLAPLMPHDYFGPDDEKPGKFYSEFCKYLVEEGYLPDLDEDNGATSEDIKDKLADLLDAQANIHKSPLRTYALIQCLGYVGIDNVDISWQSLAKIIHAIDNDEISEDLPVVKDATEETDDQFDLKFLEERTKAVAVELIKNPRYYSEKINRAFANLQVEDTASKKARLRCLCQADDLNFLSNKTVSTTLSDESSKTENRPPVDPSQFFDFLMLEQESDNYLEGAGYFVLRNSTLEYTAKTREENLLWEIEDALRNPGVPVNPVNPLQIYALIQQLEQKQYKRNINWNTLSRFMRDFDKGKKPHDCPVSVEELQTSTKSCELEFLKSKQDYSAKVFRKFESLHTPNYEDVYKTMYKLCDDESMRFMLNKLIVAPLFTLFLHHGIMYRGATTSDPQPDAIYQNLDQLRQAKTLSRQQKYTYVDRAKQCVNAVKLIALIILKILIPVIAKAAYMLIKFTLNVCMSLILGSIKTIVYTFPLSFYRQNYFYIRSTCRCVVSLYDKDFIYSQTILKPIMTLSYRVLRTFVLIPFMVLSTFKSIMHRLVISPVITLLRTFSNGPMYLFSSTLSLIIKKSKGHHDALSSSDLMRSKIKRAKQGSKHSDPRAKAFQPKTDIMKTMSDDVQSSLELFSGMLPSM